MTRDELLRLVTTNLDVRDDAEAWSQRPGAVLYSNMSTIRPGRFYLLGINPGGVGGSSIRETLCAEEGTNHFADQCWQPSCSTTCEHLDPITGRLRPEARVPMQERVCDLIEALGAAPAAILSTNLAFARSPKLDKLSNAGEWFRRCWPVHQALLREVRPAWIMMLGYGEAYYFVTERGTAKGDQQPIGSGSAVAWHRRLSLPLGEGPALETRVLAVAHPGTRGFARAGLGAARRYPDELKDFIAASVRTECAV